MRVIQIGRDHSLVKFVDLGLEVLIGSARSKMASPCGHRRFNCLRTLVTQRFRTASCDNKIGVALGLSTELDLEGSSVPSLAFDRSPDSVARDTAQPGWVHGLF
jgi:hypothetical protein